MGEVASPHHFINEKGNYAAVPTSKCTIHTYFGAKRELFFLKRWFLSTFVEQLFLSDNSKIF